MKVLICTLLILLTNFYISTQVDLDRGTTHPQLTHGIGTIVAASHSSGLKPFVFNKADLGVSTYLPLRVVKEFVSSHSIKIYPIYIVICSWLL